MTILLHLSDLKAGTSYCREYLDAVKEGIRDWQDKRDQGSTQIEYLVVSGGLTDDGSQASYEALRKELEAFCGELKDFTFARGFPSRLLLCADDNDLQSKEGRSAYKALQAEVNPAADFANDLTNVRSVAGTTFFFVPYDNPQPTGDDEEDERAYSRQVAKLTASLKHAEEDLRINGLSCPTVIISPDSPIFSPLFSYPVDDGLDELKSVLDESNVVVNLTGLGGFRNVGSLPFFCDHITISTGLTQRKKGDTPVCFNVVEVDAQFELNYDESETQITTTSYLRKSGGGWHKAENRYAVRRKPKAEHYLKATIERIREQLEGDPLVILTGRPGAGKLNVIRRLEQAVEYITHTVDWHFRPSEEPHLNLGSFLTPARRKEDQLRKKLLIVRTFGSTCIGKFDEPDFRAIQETIDKLAIDCARNDVKCLVTLSDSPKELFPQPSLHPVVEVEAFLKTERESFLERCSYKFPVEKDEFVNVFGSTIGFAHLVSDHRESRIASLFRDNPNSLESRSYVDSYKEPSEALKTETNLFFSHFKTVPDHLKLFDRLCDAVQSALKSGTSPRFDTSGLDPKVSEKLRKMRVIGDNGGDEAELLTLFPFRYGRRYELVIRCADSVSDQVGVLASKIKAEVCQDELCFDIQYFVNKDLPDALGIRNYLYLHDGSSADVAAREVKFLSDWLESFSRVSSPHSVLVVPFPGTGHQSPSDELMQGYFEHLDEITPIVSKVVLQMRAHGVPHE